VARGGRRYAVDQFGRDVQALEEHLAVGRTGARVPEHHVGGEDEGFAGIADEDPHSGRAVVGAPARDHLGDLLGDISAEHVHQPVATLFAPAVDDLRKIIHVLRVEVVHERSLRL